MSDEPNEPNESGESPTSFSKQPSKPSVRRPSGEAGGIRAWQVLLGFAAVILGAVGFAIIQSRNQPAPALPNIPSDKPVTLEDYEYRGKKLPEWITALKSADADIQKKAAETLGGIEEKGRPLLVPLLLVTLKDDDAKTRRLSADILGKIKTDRDKVIPALALVLHDKNPLVRRAAATALVQLGRGKPESLGEIIKTARAAKDPDVRQLADYIQQNTKSPEPKTVEVKPPVKLPPEGEWATHFPEFLRRLGYILNSSPVTPPKKDDPGILTLVEKDDKPRFLVPPRYPTAKDARIEETTQVFHEKTITWELVVEGVEMVKDTGKVILHFAPPTRDEQRIANISQITAFDEFSIAVAEESKDQAKRLKPGNKVVIKAESGNEPMDGIFFMFGVGARNGEIRVSIRLRRGALVTVR